MTEARKAQLREQMKAAMQIFVDQSCGKISANEAHAAFKKIEATLSEEDVKLLEEIREENEAEMDIWEMTELMGEKSN